jgi:glycine cleavage system aminomethyltransferase T
MDKIVLILHDEPVYAADEIVGHCTSGGHGFRTGKILCFVMFYDFKRSDQHDCEIEVAGQRYLLRLLQKPPYQLALR